MPTWPDDVDGDVFRRLAETGFEFEKLHVVDFTVDFNTWPPSENALRELSTRFGEVTVYEPEDECDGYVLFSVEEKLTYELVMSVQSLATTVTKQYGGICESWGVWQE